MDIHASKSISVIVDGQAVEFDQQPFIDVRNRTMVPVRFISEALGCEVNWNQLKQEVSIKNDTISISLIIGENKAIVNKKPVFFDTSAIVINNRTLVPVRFISETLGATVNWDPNTWTVSITSNDNSEVLVSGNTYYVSNQGSDSNDGLSKETPLKTIGFLNDLTLNPGDQVLFERGDTFRETLYIRNSGLITEPIRYGAYGVGDRPKIYGSNISETWTEVSTNIWKSDQKFENPYLGGYSYGEVFFETFSEEFLESYQWGHHEEFTSSYSNLNNEYDWTFNAGSIYIFSTKNPSNAYKSVEVPQRDKCIGYIEINGDTILDEDKIEYIIFDGLEVMYARRQGIYTGYNEVNAKGLTITDCHIGCIGVKGGASAYGIAAWYSDMTISNNIIHDCGRRGISINTYTNNTPDLDVSHILIDDNYFYNGYHTTGIDISSMDRCQHTFSDIVISNNVFDDTHIKVLEETSNMIYIEGNNSDYHDFTIYNNVLLGTSARAILVKRVTDLNVWYNTIYGLHKDARPYSMVTFAAVNNIDFRNNLIHGTLAADDFAAFCVLDEKECTFETRDYNLYYQDDPDQVFNGSYSKGGYPTMNAFYSWQQETQWDLHAPYPSQPLLENIPYDFRLTNLSPALNGGTPITISSGHNLVDLSVDIFGNTRDVLNPSIGAVE